MSSTFEHKKASIRKRIEFKAQFHEPDIINVEHAIHDDGNGWH